MNDFKFKLFSQYKNISHGISTKNYGTMKSDNNSINKMNLENFLSYMKMPTNGICMGQIHGGNAVVVSDDKNLLIENTDGLVTSNKNIALCVMTADCLPILLFDPIKLVIGVVHAGRKGLLIEIIKNTIEKFKIDFKCNPENITIGIGPGIEEKCYDVDGERFDLRKMANDQLLAEGISPEKIENIEICTKCEDKFYSFRGGDETDRFVCSISLI